MNRWVHASFKTIWTLGEAKTKFFPLCPECLQRFILGCLVLLATSSSCCCFCWLCCPFACGSNGRKQIWGEWKTAVCWLRILICHQCCCFACDWFEWPGIGTSPWELTRFPRLCRRRDYGGGASGRYEPMGRYDDPPRGPPSSRYDDPPRGPSMSSRYDDPPRGPPSKWRFQAAVFVVRGLCAIATCTCVCAPAGVVGVVLQHHQVPSWAAPQGSTCYLCCLPPPPGENTRAKDRGAGWCVPPPERQHHQARRTRNLRWKLLCGVSFGRPCFGEISGVTPTKRAKMLRCDALPSQVRCDGACVLRARERSLCRDCQGHWRFIFEMWKFPSREIDFVSSCQGWKTKKCSGQSWHISKVWKPLC